MTATPTIALQLYTLRDQTAQDMEGALRAVAAMGYQGVELAGYGNLSVAAIADLTTELGLKIVGSHQGFTAIQDDLNEVVEANRTLGNTHIVCPSIPADLRGSAEGYAGFGKTLTALGEKLREAGLQLCYHNHAFELEDQFDGKYGLDILYENSDPAAVQGEIDTYWIKRGGGDPAPYIAKYAGRAPLIHIKDMGSDAEQSFAEVGTGILDWPAIFKAAEAGGARAYIVEQDICPGNPLDSVRLSLANLKQMGKLS